MQLLEVQEEHQMMTTLELDLLPPVHRSHTLKLGLLAMLLPIVIMFPSPSSANPP